MFAMKHTENADRRSGNSDGLDSQPRVDRQAQASAAGIRANAKSTEVIAALCAQRAATSPWLVNSDDDDGGGRVVLQVPIYKDLDRVLIRWRRSRESDIDTDEWFVLTSETLKEWFKFVIENTIR